MGGRPETAWRSGPDPRPCFILRAGLHVPVEIQQDVPDSLSAHSAESSPVWRLRAWQPDEPEEGSIPAEVEKIRK